MSQIDESSQGTQRGKTVNLLPTRIQGGSIGGRALVSLFLGVESAQATGTPSQLVAQPKGSKLSVPSKVFF